MEREWLEQLAQGQLPAMLTETVIKQSQTPGINAAAMQPDSESIFADATPRAPQERDEDDP